MEDSPQLPEVTHNTVQSRYEMEIDGHIAHADYILQNQRMVITLTWVPPELRGKGIAAPLVRAALDDARRQGREVVPQCSYVARFVEKNTEYASLVAK